MRTYVPPAFAKDAKKADVSDDDLREAIARAERGLIDGSLDGHLIKQRIPREGQGRSGGFRSIIAYKRGELAIFLYLFPKNAKSNLTKKETEVFRDLAATLTDLSDETLMKVAATKRWRQIKDEEPEDEIPK